jgi:heptosyltransferase-2
MSTAVVVPHKGIGDLIWHLPYIRAIAAGSAGGQVTVIARPSSRAVELLSAESTVSRVIEFDRRPRGDEGLRGRHDGWREQWSFACELRRSRIGRIYIFSGRFRHGLLARLAGIRQRSGFGFTLTERLFLNDPPYIQRHRGPGNWVYPEATAFALAHGLVTGPVVPRMHVSPEQVDQLAGQLVDLPHPRYAFAIGSSDRRRNWGAERFASLAQVLAASGAGIVLLGGQAEQTLAHEIVGAVSTSLRGSVRPMCQASVLVSAAALRNCDVCIGNDTGVLNMAAACGLPTLGLFGASPPLKHDPLLRAVIGATMDQITVQAVLSRIKELPSLQGQVPSTAA